MAHASWSLDLPEGRHEIDVTYGYWLGKATIRVDRLVVSASRPLMSMSVDLGVDIPIEVDGKVVVVSIRPITVGRIIATGYRFGISIDGAPAPGTETISPVQPGSNPLGRGWPTSGARLVEAMSWASVGGAILGLGQHGQNPTAFLYLAAPAACSVVTRRTSLPTWLMGLVCLAILIAGMVTVALIGAVIR